MTEQLDLFMSANTDYAEQEQEKAKQVKIAMAIEKAKKERQDFLTQNLNARQHRLVDWLKDNFVSGRYYTIEEICDADLGYVLNKNPRIHDKCASLSADIRAINWAIAQRYSIIIKDDKGSCKLAESKTEFDAWKQKEKDKVEKKYQYLNNLEYKADRDGTMPIINLNDRALEDHEYDFVKVFKGEE